MGEGQASDGDVDASIDVEHAETSEDGHPNSSPDVVQPSPHKRSILKAVLGKVRTIYAYRNYILNLILFHLFYYPHYYYP